LNTSHVVGGGFATLFSAVAVSLVNHFFHAHVSDADAMVIGGAVLSAGVGLGHVIGSVGVAGLFSRILHGSKAPVA
jgi:hypothetical protein